MPTTYTAIATVTVGAGGASSIQFSSIPQTYSDLVIFASLRDNSASNWQNSQVTFNGGSGFSSRALYEFNNSVASSTYASNIFTFNNSANSTASTFGNLQIYIPSYASANNKSVSIDAVSEGNAADQILVLTAGLWSSSSAITQITLTPAGSAYVQYSTATLYGISNS